MTEMLGAVRELQEVVASTGLPLSTEEIAEDLQEAFRRMRGQLGTILDAREPLSESEADAIRSDTIDPDAAVRPEPILRAVSEYSRLIATALPTATAAQRLQVTPGRVRGLVAEGALLAVKVRGDSRLPLFQFQGERLVPHIESVVRKLRLQELDPLAVEQWFLIPRAELDDLSVRQWLAQGRPANIVQEIARRAHVIA